MENTTQNAANIPDGSLVVFTPRGQDVELTGKVLSRYTSTLDNNLYLKIKAEDGRTYTKQLKNVALYNGELPQAGAGELPESLLNELRKLTGQAVKKVAAPVRNATAKPLAAKEAAQREVQVLVKKYFKNTLLSMAKSLG